MGPGPDWVEEDAMIPKKNSSWDWERSSMESALCTGPARHIHDPTFSPEHLSNSQVPYAFLAVNLTLIQLST